jgi:hypothetical protein
VRPSGPSVLDQATVSRPSIVTNGHQLGEIHPAIFWFGPSLVPVRTRVGENSCAGAKRFPVYSHAVRLWTGRRPVARLPPISTNGHQPAENGRKKSIRGSVYPFFTLGTAIRPLYLLMGIDSAKVCASPKIFFWAGRRRRSRPVPVGLQAEHSNLLMHIDWAKTSTLAAKNYSPCRRCLLWSLPQQAPLAFLISPNAHRVGKNHRTPPKNLSSGRPVGP